MTLVQRSTWTVQGCRNSRVPLHLVVAETTTPLCLVVGPRARCRSPHGQRKRTPRVVDGVTAGFKPRLDEERKETEFHFSLHEMGGPRPFMLLSMAVTSLSGSHR